MDQDAIWYCGRPRPRRHYVRCGPKLPHKKGAQPLLLGPYLLWPNGRISQLLIITLLRVRRLAAFRRMLGTPRTKTDQRADYGEIIALHLVLSTTGVV